MDEMSAMDTETRKMSTAQLTWRNITLFLVTLGALALCLLMLRPFLPATVGAIVLATVTNRPYRWLLKKVGSPTWAASIATSFVTLSIIVPALFLAQVISQYLLTAAGMVQDGTLQRVVNECLDHYPQLAYMLRHSSEMVPLSQAAERAADFLSTNFVTFLGNSVAALTQTVIMLFFLFFLFRDDRDCIRFVSALMPMTESDAQHLITRIDETIRATFLGNFLVAAIQGLLAGIIFAALGIPDATVLGVLVAAAAIFPYFGAYVIWFPVVVYFAMSGHWIKAVILCTVGTLIISTLDNFLYPILVGARLRQHPISVFLSLLGGIWLFGVSGLVLGPVIFSVAEVLLTIWNGDANRTTLLLPDSQ